MDDLAFFLPVSLQRPYAADPGHFTQWLVTNTADLGQDTVFTALAAMSAKYARVVDPLITQERINAMLRELAEERRSGIRRIGILPFCNNVRRREANVHNCVKVVPVPE
jgi:hypothetical protein